MIEFNGYSLKEGFYELCMDEIEEYFVKNMPNMYHRATLLDAFREYCKEMERYTDKYFQIIDGSFTTKKKEPNDIDVVNFVDVDTSQKIAHFKEKSGIIYRYIDGYFAPLCDKNSPYYHVYKERLDYWKRWLGTTRDDKKKGLVIKLHNVEREVIC